jgi:cell division protease FtsH
LKPHERVWKVTIIRRGGALGLAATKPTKERYNRSDSEILAEIQVCLAARAAEEEFLRKKLNGVTSDLKQATQLAGVYLGMVGMGDELFSWLAIGSQTDALKQLRPKINELLQDQMNQVKSLVKEQSDFIHEIAAELLKRGDLTGEEIEQIYVRLNGHIRQDVPEIKANVVLKKEEEEDDTTSENN